MPYVSRRQEAYFNANRSRMERQGVNVDEWNQASKGLKLPERSASSMEHARKPEKKTLGGKSFTSHPGRLHRELGIPLGEKIGEERERKALNSSKPQVRRDARSALGYAAMRRG